MKIQLDKDVLADAVAWAARSLPLRPSLPILAGLLIKAEANLITLSSFDYETSAQVTIKADVEAPGLVLVSGKLLAEITKSLPQKPVTLTSTDSELELVCGSARFSLQTLPANEYPELPSMPKASGWIGSEELLKGVSQVVVAAGRDELLPVFTGVKIEFDGENLSLLGTDRYRMALKEMTWNPSSKVAETSALVPGKVLSDTAKSMASSERITISLADVATGEGLIGFEAETTDGVRQITTRLLDGEFPKLRHLMNVPNDMTVRVNTADLISAVRRVALVAEKNTSLRMKIEDDSVTLEAARGDQAQASEAVPALVDYGSGEPPLSAAGFNPHYLLDALSVMDTPYVHIAFTGSGKPCLITALAELDGEPAEDYRHVIMLMRLSN
ncbi:MAG: DNA polymerase III subunit beta [Propionibacteriaceae bacterium]|jgi:DNA polymerase-3 subunit beta|nr:DNA polymerase III subunit beta [Propionibacteriaceae bacterium]